jgi:cellulose synthase/poly-beta-1,6-N-acetylglucosamine synthase-like glycosyltransferase
MAILNIYLTGPVFLFLLLYAYILFTALKNVNTLKKTASPVVIQNLKACVVIAVRNEENNILRCLDSILKGNPDKRNYEIIVINDHSTDNTKKLLDKIKYDNVRLFDLPEILSGKKNALEYGISLTDSEIIITTDADCILPEAWVHNIVSSFANNNKLVMTTGVVLPVSYKTTIERFQWLDFAATMALTGYGIFSKKFYLCNGANMSFLRQAFIESGGYGDNHHIASGDDVFLIKKLSAIPGKEIAFLQTKEAMVLTKTEDTWTSLLQQRKRWATKTKAYANKNIIMIQSLAFGLSFFTIAFFLPALFLSKTFLIQVLIIIIVKYSIDFIFLTKLSQHFNAKDAIKNFPISFILYQFYIIIMGVYALIPGKTTWKERNV